MEEAKYCAAMTTIELDRLEQRLDALVDVLVGKPIHEELRVLLMQHVENTISASQRLVGAKNILLTRQWKLELDTKIPEPDEGDTVAKMLYSENQ